MKTVLLALIAPLGDVSTTKGKITIAYKVALAARSAWVHFVDHLRNQHPPAVPRTEGGEPIA